MPLTAFPKLGKRIQIKRLAYCSLLMIPFAGLSATGWGQQITAPIIKTSMQPTPSPADDAQPPTPPAADGEVETLDPVEVEGEIQQPEEAPAPPEVDDFDPPSPPPPTPVPTDPAETGAPASEIFGPSAIGIETGGRTTNINAEQLQRTLTQDIRDAIRYEPGVYVESSGERFGNQNFNIRGLEGNRVLITVDGIRVPEGFSFPPGRDLGRDVVDFDAIKEIDIARGAGSLVYGSDSLGGVVAYTTFDPADLLLGDDSYLSLKSGFFTEDEQFAHTMRVAERVGDWEALLIYTRRDGHEVETNGPLPINPQDFFSNSFLGKLVYNIDNHQFIRFTGEFSDQEVGTNLLTDLSSGGFSPDSIISSGADDDSRRYRLGLDHEFFDPTGPFWQRARTQVYYQDYYIDSDQQDRRIRTSFGPPMPPQMVRRERLEQFDQRNLGGRQYFEVEFEGFAREEHRVIFGWDFDASYILRAQNGVEVNETLGTSTQNFALQQFPNKLFPDSTVRRAGAFIQDEFEIMNGLITLRPGVRGELFDLHVRPDEIFNANSVAPEDEPHDFNDQALLPKLDIILAMTDEWDLQVNYARGYQAPPFDSNILFSNLSGFFQYVVNPNPDLQSEFSDNFQIGVTHAGRRGSFYANAYYNEYDGFINQTVTDVQILPGGIPRLIFEQTNLERAEIYGWEFAAERLIMPYGDPRLQSQRHPLPGLYAFANGAYAVGNDEQNDQPINSIVPYTSVLGVRWQAPCDVWGVSFLSTLRAEKSQNRVATDDSFAGQFDGGFFAPPGYGVFDLVGYYKPYDNLTVNWGVFNIFDKVYWDWLNVRDVPADNDLVLRLAEPGINGRISVTLNY
ncbi:Hypothetical protein PBC10988_35790 [Planctomycetales bacterium 10988]|nr:Hypothetical protein PBC10988_35790 [Planctomycetales bacterium 10988]